MDEKRGLDEFGGSCLPLGLGRLRLVGQFRLVGE
jgi:hypothetical protein